MRVRTKWLVRSKKEDRILIVGGSGLIGAACLRVLHKKGYSNLLVPTHENLDFCDYNAVLRYFENNEVDVVIQAAGKVGGILGIREIQQHF